MAKRVKIYYSLPNGGHISREGVYKTVSTRNPSTGVLTGRKEVRGYGDRTGVIRVEKPFVLVKKSETARGHIRTIRQRYDAGQIIGRF